MGGGGGDFVGALRVKSDTDFRTSCLQNETAAHEHKVSFIDWEAMDFVPFIYWCIVFKLIIIISVDYSITKEVEVFIISICDKPPTY